MALIQCPECGKENVSDTAVSCPNCGFNISRYYNKNVSPAPQTHIASPEFQRKKTNVIRFLAIIFGIIAIVSGSMWIKGRDKIKDINAQYEEEHKNYLMQKALATYPDNYSLDHYDEYLDSASKLDHLSDDKSKQKKKNIISIICFGVSAILLIICFILL